MQTLKYTFFSFLIFINTITLLQGQDIEKSTIDINQIDSVFFIKEGEKRAGISSIIHLNNSLFYQKSFGYSNLAHDVPLGSETKFKVGALGKYVIALSTFFAEDQGLISLDDKITKYFDVLNFSEELTIKHLLGHTSGLHDISSLKSLALIDDAEIFTFDQLLEILSKQTRLDNAPGARYRHRDINLTLLAEIISRAAEIPFSEFAQKNIFSPLEMYHSGFLTQPRLMVKDVASSYSIKEDKFNQVLDGNSFVSATNFLSCSNDLKKLIQNMFDKSIGNKSIYERMDQTVRLDNGEEVVADVVTPTYGQLLKYNFGESPVVYQWNSAAGFSSSFYYFPEANFSSLVVTNTSEIYNGGYSWDAGEIILKDYFSTNPSNFSLKKDIQEAFINSLEKYSGDYWNKDMARIRRIYARDDTLRTARLDGGRERNLIRIGENKFQMETAYRVIFDFEIKENENLLSVTENDCKKPNSYLKAFPNKSSMSTLKDYAGSYFSDQFETQVEVKIIDNQLSLIHPSHGVIQLQHFNKDMFVSTTHKFAGIQFFRNQNNEISRLEISNAYANKILFSKE